MVPGGSKVRIPDAGVREAPVQQMDGEGIIVFYSEISQDAVGMNEHATDDVLKFHGTVQKFFQQVAVVPFRFPTMLENEAELREFIRKHAERYVKELQHLDGKVEIKVEVSAAAIEMRPTMSGTEFLRAKYGVTKGMEQFAQAIQHEAAELECEWKKRERSGGVTLFALVEKDRWQELRRRVLRVCEQEKVPARVTGPWPASDFVEQYPELG